ncbi:hypothetical protein BJ742DRAFT_680414 [Cladochytrium replicatum]|nr:hypothetical protein BJ742DRAFT_680414 [Cladochytrium replicatum]
MPSIYLLDYGAGNVRSLLNAVKRVGFDVTFITSNDDFAKADKLLFPGVGAFGAAMDRLRSTGFVDGLLKYIASGKPFMGICVGLQALCEGSEEDPDVPGLGVIPGVISKFFDNTKAVPHMGWNSATAMQGNVSGAVPAQINHDADEESTRYYFVHSYALKYGSGALADWAYSLTKYGDEVFISAIRKNNVFATQFHPEKSGFAGLKVLKTFLSGETTSIAPLPKQLSPGVLAQSIKDRFTRRIIACLDVRANDQGDLVVTKGDQYDVREKEGSGDVRNLGKPVELARRYFEEGADEVTFLNITSFRDIPVRDTPMLQVLQRTSETVFVPLTIGGGIRDIQEPSGNIVSALHVAGEYFRSGADKVSIGSDAVYAAEEYLARKKAHDDAVASGIPHSEAPAILTGKTAIEQIARVYGNQAVVISVDPRRVYVRSASDAPTHTVFRAPIPGPNGEEFCWYQCTVKGGREGRDLDVRKLVTACEAMGAGEILLNCMDRDGTNSGYELTLVQDVKDSVRIPVIASSGAGRVEHFKEVFDACGVEAALAAGIFHRREVPIEKVKLYLKENGMSVRGGWEGNL